MKDYSFKIRVGDLLNTPGSSDKIHFCDKFSRLFPDGTSSIEVFVNIKNLNKQELWVSLDDAKTSLLIKCDRCWKDINKVITFTEVSIIAKVGEKDSQELAYIDSKDMILDLEKVIIDQFFLSLSIKNLCKDCEKQSLSDELENDFLQQCIKRS